MVEEMITIPYQIKAIKPSEQKKGYVEVVMEPVESLEYHQENQIPNTPPIHISGIGPDGSPFPPEFQNQLTQMLQQAMPPMFKNKKPSLRQRKLFADQTGFLLLSEEILNMIIMHYFFLKNIGSGFFRLNHLYTFGKIFTYTGL